MRRLAWIGAGLAIVGLVVALVLVLADTGGEETSRPKTTTTTGGTAPVTTTAPSVTTSPVALAAPALTDFSATCDPGTAEPLCTIALSWSDNTSAETGYRVFVRSSSQGPPAIQWDLPPGATSWTRPWNSGDEVCASVAALRGSEAARSGERCISTGIG